MTVGDGFVPTAPAVADWMASTLFVEAPNSDDRILFPGAGTGCLAAAVQRYCSVRDHPCPEAVAVDISAERLAVLEEHVAASTARVPPLSTESVRRLRATYPTSRGSADRPVSMDVETIVGDFLLDPPAGEFDYIIANPPYTRYNALDSEKREQYAEEFQSAAGQFPLYVPFVEQMQRLLAVDGELVFIAPINYLLADFATAFREQLRRDRLEEFMLMPEEVFPHVKVETVVTALSADTGPSKDGHFWLESFRNERFLEDLLRGVGVTDDEPLAVAVEEYYRSCRMSKKRLRSFQKREGEDGGYNVSRVPPQSRPGDSHQSKIGRWSQ